MDGYDLGGGNYPRGGLTVVDKITLLQFKRNMRRGESDGSYIRRDLRKKWKLEPVRFISCSKMIRYLEEYREEDYDEIEACRPREKAPYIHFLQQLHDTLLPGGVAEIWDSSFIISLLYDLCSTTTYLDGDPGRPAGLDPCYEGHAWFEPPVVGGLIPSLDKQEAVFINEYIKPYKPLPEHMTHEDSRLILVKEWGYA